MMASAVIKIFAGRTSCSRSLILCPPKLKSMWEGYVQRFNLNADVRSIGNVPDCSERSLRGRYKLVVIDESHNLRNREGLALSGYPQLHRGTGSRLVC